MSAFISAADVNSIPPGQGRTVHVQGREFALWNVDGRFYCIDDQCPHRGGPLGSGWLKDGRVSCPLHGWEFDVRTGACSTRPDRPVATYPARVVGDKVEICV